MCQYPPGLDITLNILCDCIMIFASNLKNTASFKIVTYYIEDYGPKYYLIKAIKPHLCKQNAGSNTNL